MNSKSSFVALAVVISGAIAGCMSQPVSQSPSPSATVSSASPQTGASASPISPAASAAPATAAPTSPVAVASSAAASTNQAQSAVREVKSCVVKMAMVDDPDSPLNVRSAPTTEGSKVVGQLQNGTYLSVEKEQDGWLQISQPQPGWVAKNRTKHGCSEKVERVNLAKGETSIKIGDRFIGTGSHQYLFSGNKGQLMTITQQEGPFPMVMGPSGKAMIPGPDDQRTQWSGPLPESGDYTLQFDSNFKGYAYAVVVEIK